MSRGIEVATAYVSLLVTTKDIPKQVNSAFKDVGRIGDSAGASLGSSMSTKFGTALKAGIAGAGVAAAGAASLAIGTALTKGFQRLTAIDDAQGKLKSLGHEGASVTKIMDSALASVKGTSYGLGEAATLAATATAAGVQPGKDLTKYLSLTADAATIAGVGLSEMGSIFGKVQTQQRAYTMEINMLADRGIPIYQYLQKEMGVTQEQLRKMVAAGEVDSATYFRALERNLGGAATAATTVSSAWANTMAAMGRAGAAALGPTFGRLTGWLGTATTGIDALTPKVGAFASALDHKIFKEWGPRIGEFAQGAKSAFEQLKTSDVVVGSMRKLDDIFTSLYATGAKLGPSVLTIAGSLAAASAATGVSAWQVFLQTLQAVAPILDATLVPALQATASLMSGNQAAVTGLVLAFAAFKAIPALFTRMGAPVTNLGTAMTTATTSARTGMSGFAAAVRQSNAWMAQANPQMSTFGRNAAIAGANAKAAFTSVANGAKGLLSGGLGIGAGIFVATQMISAIDDVSKYQDSLKESSAGLAAAQRTVAEAFGRTVGAMGDSSLAAVSDQVSVFRDNLQKTATDAPGFWTEVWGGFALTKAENERISAMKAQGELAGKAAGALKELGQSDKEVAEALTGTQQNWDIFAASLRALGEGGEEAAKQLGAQREQIMKQREAAKSVTPGMVELSDAIGVLADSSADADKKAGSLRAALFTLLGIQQPLGEAMSQYEQGLADLVESSSQVADATGGLGAELRGNTMGLDMQKANARALSEELGTLRDNYISSRLAGADQAELAERNAVAFDALGKKYQFTAQEVEELARQAGLVPEKITPLIQLNGADGTEQQLFAIASRIAEIGPDDPKTVTVLGMTEDAERRLKDLGVTVERLPDGTVKVTALTDAARVELDAFVNKPRTATVNVITQHTDYWESRGYSPAQARRISGPVPVGGGFTGKRLPMNSNGSRLPTSGPGTDTVDGILGVGRDGIPTSWVDKGEWIVNGKSSEKHNRLLAAINRDDPRLKNLPGFEKGGRNGIDAALSAGKSVDGNTYLWGGTGPERFDCSGFVGWLQQIAMGIVGSVKRLYTTHNLMGSSGVAGLQPGLGPAGTQFQVGVSSDHMAATIAGQAAESGGAHGTSGIGGGRASAQSSQFSKKWHLPNSMVAAWAEGAGASLTQQASAWTEKQELDLKSADVAVTQARESLAEVQIAFNEGKKSQADLDQAELKVAKAEQKVLDMQAKKDEAASGKKGPSAQAPDLAKAYSQIERERLEAQMQVDDANIRRNDVYADVDATDNDRLRADFALQQAREDLAEVLKGKAADTSGDYSLNGILKTFAHSGIDALFAGVEGQDYFGLSESRWLSTDWTKLVGEPAIEAPEPAPFTMADIAAQTGGMSIEQILEARGIKPPKVFDNGGWLLPGETAINLSSKPEPIFNSPNQLSQFTSGEGLQPAAPTVQDFSVTFNGDVSTRDEAELVSKIRFEQKRLVYGLTGG